MRSQLVKNYLDEHKLITDVLILNKFIIKCEHKQSLMHINLEEIKPYLYNVWQVVYLQAVV